MLNMGNNYVLDQEEEDEEEEKDSDIAGHNRIFRAISYACPSIQRLRVTVGFDWEWIEECEEDLIEDLVINNIRVKTHLQFLSTVTQYFPNLTDLSIGGRFGDLSPYGRFWERIFQEPGKCRLDIWVWITGERLGGQLLNLGVDHKRFLGSTRRISFVSPLHIPPPYRVGLGAIPPSQPEKSGAPFLDGTPKPTPAFGPDARPH